MEKFTSKDIEALREYLEKIEALSAQETAGKVTAQEWDEFFSLLRETGTFPAKFAGRIAENEITVHEDIVDGKHQFFPEGIRRKAYYDIADAQRTKRISSLYEEYRVYIEKVIARALQTQGEGEEGKSKSISQLIEEAVSVPEVLDITNLPNLLPTDRRLQFAITPLRNEFAYIMPFDYEQLAFDYDENGEIVI